MKTDYVLYGILAVVVVGLAYTVWDMASASEYQIQDNVKVLDTVTSGDTSTGNVEIALTPKGMVNGKFAVEISANTHSVPLEQYDLKKVMLLTYKGKEYTPVSAPELNGHHISGEVIFDLNEVPGSYRITINGIPNIEERVFEWK